MSDCSYPNCDCSAVDREVCAQADGDGFAPEPGEEVVQAVPNTSLDRAGLLAQHYGLAYRVLLNEVQNPDVALTLTVSMFTSVPAVQLMFTNQPGQ